MYRSIQGCGHRTREGAASSTHTAPSNHRNYSLSSARGLERSQITPVFWNVIFYKCKNTDSCQNNGVQLVFPRGGLTQGLAKPPTTVGRKVVLTPAQCPNLLAGLSAPPKTSQKEKSLFRNGSSLTAPAKNLLAPRNKGWSQSGGGLD